MSVTDKLERLMALCKCSVILSINDHRDMYQTVEQWAEDEDGGNPIDVAPEVMAGMIRTNTTIRLQCYPKTPISFHVVFHHDLDAALDEMLEGLSPEGGETSNEEER